ncbi:MAG TPA: FAD-binding oxidoreductase [Actinomycetota bacterium]
MSAAVSVPQLRDAVAGAVIAPDDAAYDDARTPFYGGIDRRPAAIVRATDADDVRRVVTLARETGAELAVRSGGHSLAGHSVSEGGIVLDLADMRGLDIDVDRRTAWAQAGITAGAYTTAAAEFGLATGFGDTGSVGVGGITLGGGIGFLVRKHGLTIDDLLEAEIVTADGELLHVDEESHPDLFWAIRGGGGNFGVATRFRFRLHPVDRILGGMLFLPATPEAVEGFMAESASAPDELTTIAAVMKAPPMPFIPESAHGSLLLMAFVVYAGDPSEGERAVAPLRSLGDPLADLIRPMTYPEMYMPEEEGYHPTAAAHTGFMDRIGADDAAMIVDRTPMPGALMRVVQLRPLGGAAARVPQDATAFAHRSRGFMVNVASMYDGEDARAESQAWVDETSDGLHHGELDGYVNFVGDEGPERVRHAYPGATWDRLREIKARYDPTNLFRLNQNIPPA